MPSVEKTASPSIANAIGHHGTYTVMGSQRAANLTSWSFACLNERANGVEGLEFSAKRDNPLTSQEALESLASSHWAVRLLKTPNRYSDWGEIRRLATLFLDGSGDTFLWTPCFGYDVPQQLWLIPSRGMQIIPGAGTNEPAIVGYRFFGPGGVMYFEEREICHIRHAHAWGDAFRMLFVGRSMLEAVGDAIDVDQETMRYLKSYFQNGALPAFGLKIADAMSTPQFNQFRKRFNDSFMGAGNAGKWMLMENGMDLVTFQSGGREREIADIDNGNRDRICAVLGVPEGVLTMKHANKATADTAEMALVRRTIMKLGRLFASALSRHFSRFEAGIVLEIAPYVSMDPDEIRKDERHLVELGYPVNRIFAARGLEPVLTGDLPRFTTAIALDASPTTASAPSEGATATSGALDAVQAPITSSSISGGSQAVLGVNHANKAAGVIARATTASVAGEDERAIVLYWKHADRRHVASAAVIARGLRTVVAWIEDTVMAGVELHAGSGKRFRTKDVTFDLATAQAKATREVGPDLVSLIDDQLRQAADDADGDFDEIADRIDEARGEIYAVTMGHVTESIAKIHAEIGNLGLAMTDKPARDVHEALTSRFKMLGGSRAALIAGAAAKLIESRSKRMVWAALSPRADGKVCRGRWTSRRDLDVRDDHAKTDGVLADDRAEFAVPPGSGARMYGPGDPVNAAGVKQIHRCRCSMMPVWV